MYQTKRLGTVLILFFLLLVVEVSSYGSSGPAVDYAGGPRYGIEVVLRADQAPLPGQTATLVFEATPLVDAPDLVVNWVLPEGVELVGSQIDSLGSVVAQQTVRITRQIRFTDQGIYKVAVEAAFHPNQSTRYAAAGVLFFSIDNHTTQVSDIDPNAHSPMHSTIEATKTTTTLSTRTINASGDPCFIVQGTVTRIDKPVTPTGYDPDVIVPVNYATVLVREDDILFDDTYAEIVPVNGFFSVQFCDDDGWFDDNLEIYVRVRAEAPFIVEVEDQALFFDEVYKFDTPEISSSGGTLIFNMQLDETQSAVINILDAAVAAWLFWNSSGGSSSDDPAFDEEAEIAWEPGEGETISSYDPFWNDIEIADDASDADEWDETVIIHEWGHFADDVYGCDDNPGGPHTVNGILNPELAWGEGYPDYYQSVVRDSLGDPNSEFYIDQNGSGNGFNVNLETGSGSSGSGSHTWSTVLSPLNEMAIAATLWDFYDAANEPQDRVSHGHELIQHVYTSDGFVSQNSNFDACDFRTYMGYWFALGMPTDAQTAAVVQQNTSISGIFSAIFEAGFSFAPSQATSEDIFRWWDQMAFVVDNSASMAGAKFDAVKTVLPELVNDVSAEPRGVEFALHTFNNSSITNQSIFGGLFFADTINPVIDSLTTISDPDSSCKVNAFNALSQAIDEKSDVDAWVFTDGDAYTDFPTVDTMKSILAERNARASFVLLGLCPSTTTAASEDTLVTQRQFKRAVQHNLGFNIEEPADGIVPYLLTATGSGGQLLFVDSSQMEDAGSILRAQLSHSAGAGRWSDYVSEQPTYIWDELATWEYNWIDATDGDGWGRPGGLGSEGYVSVSLPKQFTFYNSAYSVIQANENGYLTFGTSPQNIIVLPVYSWWNPVRGDNFATTDPNWSGNIGDTQSGYTLYRIEGYIFDPNQPQPAGTVPVYSWWNPVRGDNFATTDPNWSGNIGDTQSGYTLYRIEGYIFDPNQPQPAGTVPVYSWWNPGTGDNFATTDPNWSGNTGDTQSGYTLYRIEGYMYSDPYPEKNNTQLPNTTPPNQTLYPFWDDLEWELIIIISHPETKDNQLGVPTNGTIYSKQVGDWFAIEYHQFAATTSPPGPPYNPERFETLLNLDTGEIRFQYDAISSGGAGQATIGLENQDGTNGVQISYNDINGASSGMGYKFVPAPAQPTKTYSVTVDSTMESVGFLLTGFSGSFDPIIVRYPDGSQVDCNVTTDVLCLELGLVQYVQVDVNDRMGDWTIEVISGPTGSGTFSFTSMAASELSAQSSSPRNLSTGVGHTLLVNLGQAIDQDTLIGQFHSLDDSLFGETFALYDDGGHDDGDASDGVFVSDLFIPSEAGLAYLWVEGVQSGETFQRMDMTPFNFQPVRLIAPENSSNTGSDTSLEFELYNDDVYDHCYDIDIRVPTGWAKNSVSQICLPANGSTFFTVEVNLSSGVPNAEPSGTTGVVTVSAIEAEQGLISVSTSARVTRYRPPAEINIHNPSRFVNVDSNSTMLRFYVSDEQGYPVEDGTEVQLSTTLGSLPTVATTENGLLEVTFSSDNVEGIAEITTLTNNGITASTTINVIGPVPNQIELVVSKIFLPPDGVSTANLEAIVRDQSGNPLPNQTVRIGVEGDGQLGLISGSEVITGTSDANGQLSVIFTSGTLIGEVGVRAELLVEEGGRYRAIQVDRKMISIAIVKEIEIYLPLILK